MNRSIKQYHLLSILAALVFLLLVSLQIVWVVKAVKFQEREIIHALKEVVSDVAMEINGIDHQAFHGDLKDLTLISTDLITKKVDDYLHFKNINKKTYFAIFQDSTGGIFKSNADEFRDVFIQSDVKACISCIVSFSTVAKKDSAQLDPDTFNADSMEILSTFQYYSPVKGLTKEAKATLWLSLYQPNTLSSAIKSLLYLFALNIVLLLFLLMLFYNLLKSLSKHKQLTKVKDDFFNNMTHEFKTPLSSIRLASRVLRENGDPAKRTIYYDLIEKESKSLEFQIDKLLELSLLDNNEIMLEKNKLDLCVLLQEIPIKLKPILEDKSGNLHLNCQVDKIYTVGDRYHLLNSFCNLVENSLKYSPEGVDIWIDLSNYEKGVVVSIRDNGPGIKEEHHANIFSRFYRGQTNDNYEGAGFGIGLSYVKNIIEAHGGNIALNTQLEKGTEFIINLT